MQLHRALPQIHKRGAELVVIGNGNRHFATAFRDDLKLDVPIYVDTKRESYKALGMKRSMSIMFSPKALANMARALKAGFRQGRTQGDAFQLGGVLVVKPGGKILYQYLSTDAGDHPPVEDVLKALPRAS